MQGFNLNKMLKAIFGSLQSLTMLALLNGGCGRGIDPYLVGHTLYYSPRREGFSSTMFLILYKISWDKQKPGVWCLLLDFSL